MILIVLNIYSTYTNNSTYTILLHLFPSPLLLPRPPHPPLPLRPPLPPEIKNFNGEFYTVSVSVEEGNDLFLLCQLR